MGLRINQNIAAFNAFRNLSVSDMSLSKSLEKLSSGFRINRAADDAAGLVKSESLRSEIRGNQQAVRNAQDAISFVQTGEGALTEVHSILQRIRELAVDAANTATTDGAAQQAEVDQLLAELDAIGTKTRFTNIQVFQDYTTTGLTFQVGSGSTDQLTFSQNLSLSTASATSIFGTNLSSINLTASAAAAIDILDTAIASVSTARANLGAVQNRLEHTISNLSVAVENLSASESRIRDTDMALEVVNFTRHQILLQAGTAMLAQANAVPQNVLALLR